MTGDAKVLLKPVMRTSDFALLMTHVMKEPWSTKRARRWLQRRGLLQDFGNGMYCVTKENLERHLPGLTGDMRVMEAREGRRYAG